MAAAPQAPEVTFARDIAPLMYEVCASCHREGGPAPFSLITYDQVRRRATQIADVTPGGPADDAGMRVGDVVTKIDGAVINNPSDLSSLINTKGPGDHITVTVQRGGSSQDLVVALRDRPAHIP